MSLTQNFTPSLVPSLSLEDIAALYLLDPDEPLYTKIRNFKYDCLLFDVLFKDKDLFYVNKYKIKLLCFIAVKNGGSIRNVPLKYMSIELCWIAVKFNSRSIGDIMIVAPEFVTYEMRCAASASLPLEFIVELFPELVTYELCLTKIRKCGLNFRYVPDELITSELCYEAVKNCGEAIYDVATKARHFVTKDVCRAAIDNSSYAIETMVAASLKDMLNIELCERAVSKRGDAINCIPKYYRTQGLYYLAFKNDPNVIKCMVEDSRIPITLKMARIAVRYNNKNLKHVPKKFKRRCYYELDDKK